jgi:hypothetical protein
MFWNTGFWGSNEFAVKNKKIKLDLRVSVKEHSPA